VLALKVRGQPLSEATTLAECCPERGAHCLLLAGSVEKVLAAVGTKFLRAADAFNAVRHGVDHVDLNRSFRRPSSSHEERILRRNLPPASFCENFVFAVFSTFSKVSALRGHFACAQQSGRFRCKAEIRWWAPAARPVENDPIRTSTALCLLRRATQTFRHTSVYDYIQLFGRVIDRRP
jgi:hypothetical protein